MDEDWIQKESRENRLLFLLVLLPLPAVPAWFSFVQPASSILQHLLHIVCTVAHSASSILHHGQQKL